MTENIQTTQDAVVEAQASSPFDAHTTLTVTTSPHIKSPTTSRSLMLDVVIALLPATLWGIYVFGVRALIVTLISMISAIVFEGLYQWIMKKPITVLDFSACLTGLLVGLNMPANVPFYVPVIGSFFAIVVVKQLFGGLGKNFMNPALTARAFLMLAWPNAMTASPMPFDIDTVASATPMQILKTGALPEGGIYDLLLGIKSGCIGEISALLLLAGGVYLIVRRVITWHIPVAYIGTVALLTFIFPQNIDVMSFMLSELFSGGLMLGAIFMATDYVTSPITAIGRLIYGVGCGLITVFIRYFGGYAEGVTFAILIMNTLVWYIDMLTKPRVFGTSRKAKKETGVSAK